MKLDKSVLISLDSGQAFRWYKNLKGFWQGIINDTLYVLTDNVLSNIESESELYNFFNMGYDWDSIVNSLKNKSDYLDDAINKYSGLRILRQNHFETIISFIISSCNNISRIKKIIDSFCKNFGRPVKRFCSIDYADGAKYYSFPTLSDLSSIKLGDLEICKMGFRAEYVYDAIQKIYSGDIDLDKISCLNYEESKAKLKKIKGIGDKVASCVLLFSYPFLQSFPKDVWIKRVMSERFSDKDEEIFGKYAGVAQQYLFMKVRDESNSR